MSTIRTADDVNQERSNVFAGESHSRSRLLASRWLAVVAPALALVYPWCLTLLERSVVIVRHSGEAQAPLAWIGMVFAVALVSAVPAGSLIVGHLLGNVQPVTRRQRHGRWAAHLAFTAPSMLVATGNFARLLDARSLVTPAWLVLWFAAALFVLLSPQNVLTPTKTPAVRRLPLRTFHAISAAGILAMFLVPHISNHVTAIWSGETHIGVMRVLRTVYRSGTAEPILVALLAFQMVSGLALVIPRVRLSKSGVFDTLQTMSGIYLFVFLTSHMTAAFSARAANVDTNWLWLVGRAGTLLASPSMTVVPHYFLGPLILFTHVACGLRNVRFAGSGSPLLSNRWATGMIATGALVGCVILAALFGVHVRS